MQARKTPVKLYRSINCIFKGSFVLSLYYHIATALKLQFKFLIKYKFYVFFYIIYYILYYKYRKTHENGSKIRKNKMNI